MSASIVLAGFGLMLWLMFAVLAIAAFVFWILMLINAIGNNRLSGTGKVVWVLVIIFLHFLGAIIYYFVGKDKAT